MQTQAPQGLERDHPALRPGRPSETGRHLRDIRLLLSGPGGPLCCARRSCPDCIRRSAEPTGLPGGGL
ncbi:hypothetical protein DGo_CA0659 [Deinococcus gobiensis I-0]|uniref:Uncharacterized protein n=1 Tax=Deinococcus gobiensis (strain DSM 21396 / JCM 16679 / CGMCC 1.7299 / I-0) TaxID=745776 RepID=H8GX46_DEIGI|nr:hypothetical protein DGo_CA0659 [Deinococcus gobiensis I-0]